MVTPRFLVLAGDGINCERETLRAIDLAGGAGEIKHVNDFIECPKMLFDYQGLALPGGFSFGDEIASGRILALKLERQCADILKEFIAYERAVIGICNGFQVLTQLGLVPGGARRVSLTHNKNKRFIDKWVSLTIREQSHCRWVKNMKPTLELPIRHGEGRIVISEEVPKEFIENHIVMTYDEDINGSFRQIAALTDESGWVLGIMPHPEAFVHPSTHYSHRSTEQMGLDLFKSIVCELKEN